ncbi:MULTISPECIES: universal stress protein [Rufibacter]|uniref:Nucleotide-binding universal stress UspA family protein n=1 Tax=Rufibacter quisquiliarum TaxID=1549639 RepID=A0A839GJC9_9BACT|nr:MULTISPECIES: universal stress protein [Rufibacter]MBA9075705.1 nucleotide-binding universal stress UspA family protein [Rufibacter quisquiliarum]
METILCPVDFSDAGVNAVRYANELAQRMKAQIVLYYNLYEPSVLETTLDAGASSVPLRDEQVERSVQGKLESLKKVFEDEEQGEAVPFQIKLSHGVTREAIPETARQLWADLIVMGHEEAEGLEEIVQHSLAAHVIKEAACPVLIIPVKAAFQPVRKIVFATDLTGEPFGDVSFVSRIAGLFGAEIMFLHILTKDSPEKREQAQSALEAIRERLAYHNASLHVVEEAQVEEGISRFCRDHHANMLVLGFHPRSFWQHLLPGNYTQEMACHTYLPMLLVHFRR